MVACDNLPMGFLVLFALHWVMAVALIVPHHGLLGLTSATSTPRPLSMDTLAGFPMGHGLPPFLLVASLFLACS